MECTDCKTRICSGCFLRRQKGICMGMGETGCYASGDSWSPGWNHCDPYEAKGIQITVANIKEFAGTESGISKTGRKMRHPAMIFWRNQKNEKRIRMIFLTDIIKRRKQGGKNVLWKMW